MRHRFLMSTALVVSIIAATTFAFASPASAGVAGTPSLSCDTDNHVVIGVPVTNNNELTDSVQMVTPHGNSAPLDLFAGATFTFTVDTGLTAIPAGTASFVSGFPTQSVDYPAHNCAPAPPPDKCEKFVRALGPKWGNALCKFLQFVVRHR
jgi:hypothetical protein